MVPLWVVTQGEACHVSICLKIWLLGNCPGAWAVAHVDTCGILGNCPYIMFEYNSYW